jgi:hypothetical protein
MNKSILLLSFASLLFACKQTTIKKVLILENNTTSYIYLNTDLDTIFTKNDTIWINTITHKIDDSDNYTMMAVIK